MGVKTLKEFFNQISILELSTIVQNYPALASDINEYLDSYNKGELLNIRDIMKGITLPSFPLGDKTKIDVFDTLGNDARFKYNNLLAYYSIINSQMFNSFSSETKEKLKLAVKAIITQIRRQTSTYGDISEAFWIDIDERRSLVKEQASSIEQYMRYNVEEKGLFLLPSEIIDGQIIYPNTDLYAPYATKKQLQDENYDGAWENVIVVENPFTK